MPVPATEQHSQSYRAIDTWPGEAVLGAILAAQRGAVAAVEAAVPALSDAGEAIARRLQAGGRLVYAGAGTSGLLALLDALELPGTYGIAAGTVPVLLAGGPAALDAIPSGAEDDAEAAALALADLRPGPADALLAVSASGSTPYALGALRAARAAGLLTVGLACNPGTPLLAEADHAVLLATPPEVVAGSTRMNAGTAQRCALTMLSTLVALRLGHVHDGLMVNLRPENAKLRRRAVGIVAAAAGVGEAAAGRALAEAGEEVKTAILLCAGAPTPEAARTRLAEAGGVVRPALAGLAGRAA